jgi:hypothetical protein
VDLLDASSRPPAHTHDVSTVATVSLVETVEHIDIIGLEVPFLQKMRLVVTPAGDVSSNTISSPSKNRRLVAKSSPLGVVVSTQRVWPSHVGVIVTGLPSRSQDF